ncbi:MAG: SDR family oxidoreductase, partial [Pseudomonadota bacterium]
MAKANGRKSIFITGAASGIGAETARLFHSRGWFCGLYDIDEAGLKAVAEEIGAENCHVATLNVVKREDWAAAMMGFGKATGGKMNVLFNNAGIGRHGWFEDIPPEEADLVVDVNVKGVINGIYASIPLLKETDEARIVNTASTAGVVGSPRLAVYSATKFAVRGLTEALDVELSGLGIRCTSLMPWFIDTPILDMGLTEGANVKMADEIRE